MTAEATKVDFYLSPDEAWQAMYQDCGNASQSIFMEQYILMNDDVGRKFLHLFLEKAQQGVQIHLMLDRVGSRSLYGSRIIRELRHAGATIDFYNIIGVLNLFRPHTWFPRNHSKNLVIDETIAYAGSVCFAAYMRHWRDTHMRITGPVVEKIINSHKKKAKNKIAVSAQSLDYVATTPKLKTNPLYKQLLQEIRDAKHEIKLVTPYFLPPRKLLTTLSKAVKRGVDVQIMMSMESDSAFTDDVSYSYLPRMFKKGIRIFLYNKTFLHAKYMMIDSRWATVGSTNLDYLSLLRNQEANILIYEPEIISQLQSHYNQDLDDCDEINMAFYQRLPWVRKLIGKIGHIFRWVL